VWFNESEVLTQIAGYDFPGFNQFKEDGLQRLERNQVGVHGRTVARANAPNMLAWKTQHKLARFLSDCFPPAGFPARPWWRPSTIRTSFIDPVILLACDSVAEFRPRHERDGLHALRHAKIFRRQDATTTSRLILNKDRLSGMEKVSAEC
jgi:hypothetical protein